MNSKFIQNKNHSRMSLSGISSLFKKADETPDYNSRGWKTKNHSRMSLSGISGMAKGFTLIELLVVVLIIGILAAIALPKYGRAVERAHASEVLIKLKALYNATQVYKLANNGSSLSEQDIKNIGAEVLGACEEYGSGSVCGATCPSKTWQGCFYDNYVDSIDFYYQRNPSDEQIRITYDGKDFYCSPYPEKDGCQAIGFTKKSGSNYYQ